MIENKVCGLFGSKFSVANIPGCFIALFVVFCFGIEHIVCPPYTGKGFKLRRPLFINNIIFYALMVDLCGSVGYAAMPILGFSHIAAGRLSVFSKDLYILQQVLLIVFELNQQYFFLTGKVKSFFWQ